MLVVRPITNSLRDAAFVIREHQLTFTSSDARVIWLLLSFFVFFAPFSRFAETVCGACMLFASIIDLL